MNIKIQAINFEANPTLIEFTENKLAKFERFTDKITGGEVTFKLDRDDENGDRLVKMEFSLPGDVLVAEAKSKNFEESVDDCLAALKKQLDKYKAKHQE